MYYHHQLFIYLNDSKKIWSLIGDAINKRKKSKNEKISLSTEWGRMDDNSSIADFFNEYIANIATNTVRQIDS
jgi:hypothetical protein